MRQITSRAIQRAKSILRPQKKAVRSHKRATAADVKAAYRLFLARNPENRRVVAGYVANGTTIPQLINSVLSRPEFHVQKQGDEMAWEALFGVDHCSPLWHYNANFDAITLIRNYENPERGPKKGHIVNFQGVAVNTAFLPHVLAGKEGQVEACPIPANWHADIAEWAAAFRAVEMATDSFTMIELGCGWGCWMNNTGAAARKRGLPLHLIGVEADAGHLRFAAEAMHTNGFSAEQYTLIRGVAGVRTGRALFPKQDLPGAHWGLEPVFDHDPEQFALQQESGLYEEVPIIALATVIGDHRWIDLIHIDIQGGEADFVEQNIATLTERVAYLLIGTHSKPIEGRLFDVLLKAGWHLDIERPLLFSLRDGQPVTGIDGVQGWLNPRIRSVSTFN